MAEHSQPAGRTMSIALEVETWGTYSVRDHSRSRAFVADVLLYDRLMIPYPPNEAEVERWKTSGWDPDRLKTCLQTLGDLAVPVHLSATGAFPCKAASNAWH